MCAGGINENGETGKGGKNLCGRGDDPLLLRQHLFGRKLDYERLKAKMWKEKV